MLVNPVNFVMVSIITTVALIKYLVLMVILTSYSYQNLAGAYNLSTRKENGHMGMELQYIFTVLR